MINKRGFLYVAIWLVIAVALGLTVVSTMNICSESCSQAHKWRLFGLKFETFGFMFISALALSHLVSFWLPLMQLVVALLFYSAVGAELMFIYAQKYMIGAWCPVCLSIAATIFIGALLIMMQLNRLRKKERYMFYGHWKFIAALMILSGFFASFFGMHKYNYLEAAEEQLQEKIAFGNLDSDIELYLFTDWACPACRNLETRLESMVDAIKDKSRIIFVDFAVHPETLNFMPYHLSFMLYNKKEYFSLRDMLTNISKETGTPTDEIIESAMDKMGLKLKEANYADVAVCIKYFKKLGEEFNIKGTPTLVLINRETKKGKKLTGNDEITVEKILEAINVLSST